LDTIQEQRSLIEKLVKSNNKFQGNEDLFEDFCSETYKRSYSLFETLNTSQVESYIAKVVNTAILNVLKESGRIRRRSNQYVSTNEIPVSPVATAGPVSSANMDIRPISFCNVADPRDSFEEKIVRRDLLQKIVDVVLVAQKNYPDKEYLKIFYMRYIREMKQKDIAGLVNLSQSEVSKRLLSIAEIVKKHFNG
jgi:RNA polymerase sigma factor (sigma-70 family)